MKKVYYLATLVTLSFSASAQRVYDDYMDDEDTENFERYAHFGLSKGEIISIFIGIILLLIAKSMTEKNQNLRFGLGCVGVLCALPLVLVILAVAQKAIGYAVILALVVGGLYLLFGQNR